MSALCPRERLRLLHERLRALVPLAVIAGVLALVPFRTCVFYLATGLPCPACGFTRATLRLLHFDLHGSLRFHPLALPGGALLAFSAALAVTLPRDHPLWPRYVRAVAHTSAAAFAGVWILRLAKLLPPV